LTATGTEDSSLIIYVTSNDTDLDNAIVSITGLTQVSTGGTLSVTNSTGVLYTPVANYCTTTPLTFTYQSVDQSGALSNTATGSFTVTCVNDAPVAIADTGATARNTNILLDVLSNDLDVDHTGGELSVTGITSITGGVASLSGTSVLFTPTVGVCGTGSFTYQTEDASGATSNTTTGTVTISCTNTAPVAVDDSLTLAEDASATALNIISNDTDSDA
jgi:hypothetical protein